MKKQVLIIALIFAFGFSMPNWKPKEREKFLKECSKLHNSTRYCICFSRYLEESVSPKEMLEILKGNSTEKQNANTECQFNNALPHGQVQ